jgi:tRNA pseudouridine32 synthase/23S rRNA pseudouridine746 synthase
MLGRHPKALARLGELFRQGEVDKIYWAVVEGGPAEDEGEIDFALAQVAPGRSFRMRVDPKGQPALTRWRVLGRSASLLSSPLRGGVGDGGVGDDLGEEGRRHPHPGPPRKGEGTSDAFTLLELRPITGRTHQLRVHCAALGFPVLGDPLYGNALCAGGPGLHLHARAVIVPLYPKKPPIGVEAPVPEHMQEMVEACGLGGQ